MRERLTLRRFSNKVAAFFPQGDIMRKRSGKKKAIAKRIMKEARKNENIRSIKFLVDLGLDEKTLAEINSPTKRLLASVLESEFAQLDDLSLEQGLTPAGKRKIKMETVRAIQEAAKLLSPSLDRSSTLFAVKLRSVYCPMSEVDRICRAVSAVIMAARRQ
jgi:hypothetical protein